MINNLLQIIICVPILKMISTKAPGAEKVKYITFSGVVQNNLLTTKLVEMVFYKRKLI